MAATNPVVLALDGGTESLRAGLVRPDGTLLVSRAAPYPTRFPAGGWAEQDPEDWWSSLRRAVREVLGAPEARGLDVAGIGLDATTCTLVPVDRKGRHVRPALLWMDVRSSEQARRIEATGHPALSYSGGVCSAEWMLPKTLWLAENQPEVFSGASFLVEYTDWIGARLTGRLSLNVNTATQRWFYNSRDWGWPADLFAAVGLPDLPEKFPADLVPTGERLGGLTSECAEELGLPSGTPVFAGGGDAFVALPGLGVVAPGTVGLIIGSSTVIACHAETPVHPEGLFGPFPDAIMPGLYLIEAGQVSSGSVLSWFKRTLARDLPDERAYETLDSEASELAPGESGLIALEFFQGNRTPYIDSRARGALWGLSLGTTRAQIFRAFMEAVALGIRQILGRLSDAGYGTRTLVACGGAVRSSLFLKIISDACQVPIALREESQASLLGSAVFAAAGAGLYPGVAEAASGMTRPAGGVQPDPQQASAYAGLAELYEETYRALAPLMHRPRRGDG